MKFTKKSRVYSLVPVNLLTLLIDKLPRKVVLIIILMLLKYIRIANVFPQLLFFPIVTE